MGLVLIPIGMYKVPLIKIFILMSQMTREVVKSFEVTDENKFALTPMVEEEIVWVKTLI